jgi:hypothetical protein
MKLKLTTAYAAAALLIASSSVFATEGVVITGTAKAPTTTAYQRALSACMDGFVARILPGSSARVRVVIPPSNGTEFSGSLNPFGEIEVELKAHSAQGHILLADSFCTVDRMAKVRSLSVPYSNRAKLAGLTLKDIRVAAVSR